MAGMMGMGMSPGGHPPPQMMSGHLPFAAGRSPHHPAAPGVMHPHMSPHPHPHAHGPSHHPMAGLSPSTGAVPPPGAMGHLSPHPSGAHAGTLNSQHHQQPQQQPQQPQQSQQSQPQPQQQQQPQPAQPATGENKDATQVSSLPLPPMQYVEAYSDTAVARGIAPPPPPPITDSYSMFGHPFSESDAIVQSLEAQGIRRLYPAGSGKDVDRKRELHKLNQSVLVSFLDLLDILIRAPESPRREEKLEDLNLLFIHMHHLVNEFRPHQARETLRVMLHVQKRKRLMVAERFQMHLDKVQETIEEALRSLPEGKDQDDPEETDHHENGETNEQPTSSRPQQNKAATEALPASDATDSFMCDLADKEEELSPTDNDMEM